MNDLYFNDLENIVLLNPAKKSNFGCSRLKIVTGFTDTERISTHLLSLCDGIKAGIYPNNMAVDIILGMTQGSGLTAKKHNGIVRTIKELNGINGSRQRYMPSISCRYIYKGKNTHTKLYVWENDDEIPYIAFNGSANYSMQAFHYRRECMSLCDPVAGLNYFNSLLDDTIDCLDYTIQEREALRNTARIPDEYDDPDSKDYSYYSTKEPVPNGVLKVSLLTAKGEVGYGSGINWGIRPNGTKRDKDQAYIPYNTRDKRAGFFPDRVNPEDENCPLFRVVTKDAGTFHMRMAQAGNKALHTAESNAILGKWIRHRLGVPSGTFVTKQMLENYGRTYVTFKKYADGTYSLDF